MAPDHAPSESSDAITSLRRLLDTQLGHTFRPGNVAALSIGNFANTQPWISEIARAVILHEVLVLWAAKLILHRGQ